jgi:hypothetical protein
MEFLVSDIVRYLDKNQSIGFEHQQEILRRIREVSESDGHICEEYISFVLGGWKNDFLKKQEIK